MSSIQGQGGSKEQIEQIMICGCQEISFGPNNPFSLPKIKFKSRYSLLQLEKIQPVCFNKHLPLATRTGSDLDGRSHVDCPITSQMDGFKEQNIDVKLVIVENVTDTHMQLLKKMYTEMINKSKAQ